MNKILVIDDSELVSRLLKESLVTSGYEVALAMDANQGYAAAVEFHPDLILLDVQLPDVTGFELCRVLRNREELRQVPIMMITGTANKTEEKVRGFQMGADDYVLKPFEMPELLERVKALLRRSQAASRPSYSAGAGTHGHSHPSGEAPALPRAPLLEGNGKKSEGNGSFVPVPVLKKKDEAPASPKEAHKPPPLSLKQAISAALFDPRHFPEQARYPGVAKAYVLVLIVLSVGGVAASAGAQIKPVMAAILTAGFWGIILSVLVITSSILGVHLTWREGAGLLSLSGIPLLLKLAGGLVLAVVTTLSPFYFTASPALFMGAGHLWARRLDVFEMGSGWLLYVLIQRHPNSGAKKARVITGFVYVIAALLAAAFEKWQMGA